MERSAYTFGTAILGTDAQFVFYAVLGPHKFRVFSVAEFVSLFYRFPAGMPVCASAQMVGYIELVVYVLIRREMPFCLVRG